MKYVIFGRILPERADVWFTPQVWRSQTGDSITISCDASQLSINADLPSVGGYVDAFIMAEQVAQAVVSALGFALGTGYSVELVQVVTETGDPHTFGLRPGNLQFDPHNPVFLQAEGATPDQRIFADYLLTVQGNTDSLATRKRRAEILRQVFGKLFETKDKKRSFTVEQRRLIWHSDENKICSSCGVTLTWDNFTIDHIKPYSRGGRTTISNAALLCRECNSMKGMR